MSDEPGFATTMLLLEPFRRQSYTGFVILRYHDFRLARIAGHTFRTDRQHSAYMPACLYLCDLSRDASPSSTVHLMEGGPLALERFNTEVCLTISRYMGLPIQVISSAIGMAESRRWKTTILVTANPELPPE